MLHFCQCLKILLLIHSLITEISIAPLQGYLKGCYTCPKTTQVSKNYARVLTPTSSGLLTQIQAMFYMTYCPHLNCSIVYVLRPHKHDSILPVADSLACKTFYY